MDDNHTKQKDYRNSKKKFPVLGGGFDSDKRAKTDCFCLLIFACHFYGARLNLGSKQTRQTKEPFLRIGLIQKIIKIDKPSPSCLTKLSKLAIEIMRLPFFSEISRKKTWTKKKWKSDKKERLIETLTVNRKIFSQKKKINKITGNDVC